MGSHEPARKKKPNKQLLASILRYFWHPSWYSQILLTSLLISLLCNVPGKLHFWVDSVRSFSMAGSALSLSRVLLLGTDSFGNTVWVLGIQNLRKEFERTCFHLLSALLFVWWLRKGHKPKMLPFLKVWDFMGISAFRWVQHWNSSCYLLLAEKQLAEKGECHRTSPKGFDLYFLGKIQNKQKRKSRGRWI